MRGTVLADGNAGVGADDFYISMRVSQGISNLLECSAGGKHSERVDKNSLAAGGKARRHSHHVGLGDAHVPGPLRIKRGKFISPGAALQVRVQNHDVGVAADFGQRFAVSGTGGNLTYERKPPFQLS